MTNFESGLRGGAITLLLMLVVLLLRDGRRLQIARLTALYALGVASYVFASASAFLDHRPWWLLPLRMLSAGNCVVLWLIAATLFCDGFRPSRWHWASWGAMGIIGIACFYSTLTIVQGANTLLANMGITAALWSALSGRSEDLVEARRKLRMVFIAVAGLYSIAEMTAHFFVNGSAARLVLEIFNAAGLTAITFVFSLEFLGLRRDGSLITLTVTKRPAAKLEAASRTSAEVSEQDNAWLADLKRAMEKDKVYREEALSVAGLAAKLGIPEYRLRPLINGRLGYRNFTSFLNDYRLADAKAALADPLRAATPVLTIALTVGFQSIGPFNRAFKVATSLTPTEFRQQELAKASRRSAV